VRLIDADYLVDLLSEKHEKKDTPFVTELFERLIRLIETMPTVDVVVRCMNCKYWTRVHDYDYGEDCKGTLGRCMRSGWWYKPDHYCSQGERGDGE
jgi:hypothetical protein